MGDDGILKVVDALTLSAEHRALLRPGEATLDYMGNTHFLPRFFYAVESWEAARSTTLSQHFALAELMSVDCREASLLLKEFPHYIPCAVSLLARYLEAFRAKVENAVFIMVNGGYRSPVHKVSTQPGPHHWATAVDIYRIGDTLLDNQRDIERYGDFARGLAPEVYVKPWGHGDGETDDHLHLDIGYVSYVPRNCTEAR